MPCRNRRPAITVLAYGRRSPLMPGGRGLMMGLVMVLLLAGCTKAPQVPFDNLRYSAALLTAASSRSLEQLDRVATVIEDDSRNGRLSDQERAAYDTMITTMRAGRWTEAETACRQFRKAQLHR